MSDSRAVSTLVDFAAGWSDDRRKREGESDLMARSLWRRIADVFGTFVSQVSRQLSDVWTAPTVVNPHLVELGVVDRADRVGGSGPGLQ